MIRFAKDTDFLEIKKLWDTSFPNEEVFSKFFFENVFKLQKTLVYIKDNKIVSMLQMLDYNSNLGKTVYIYGVCTNEKYRNQGIMAKLLNESFVIAKKLGYVFSIIVPSEKYLFDIYEKYGYKRNLNIDILEFHGKGGNTVLIDSICDSDIDNVLDLYNKCLNTEFKLVRDKKYFETQMKLYSGHAVKFLQNDTIVGYAFGYKTDEGYTLDEIFANDINEVLSSYSCKVLYKTNGLNTEFAMIKSLDSILEPNGYINLMLN